MVPDPSDLYDETVRTRARWALREGLVLGAILLFWVALAAVLSIVLLIVSVPFAVLRWGAPGLPVAAAVWTIIGPLAATNAALYALARVGTLLLDRYRDGGTPAHPLSEVVTSPAAARADEAAVPDGEADTYGAADSDGADGEDDGTDDEADEAA